MRVYEFGWARLLMLGAASGLAGCGGVDVNSEYYQSVCKVPTTLGVSNQLLIDAEQKAQMEKQDLLDSGNDTAFDAWYWGESKWAWRDDLLEKVGAENHQFQCYVSSEDPYECHLVDSTGRTLKESLSIRRDRNYLPRNASPEVNPHSMLSEPELTETLKKYDTFSYMIGVHTASGNRFARDAAFEVSETLKKTLKEHFDGVSFERWKNDPAAQLDREFWTLLGEKATNRRAALKANEEVEPVSWYNVVITSSSHSLGWGDKTKKKSKGPYLKGSIRSGKTDYDRVFSPTVVWYREMTSRDSCEV